jgi:hypothetical protein
MPCPREVSTRQPTLAQLDQHERATSRKCGPSTRTMGTIRHRRRPARVAAASFAACTTSLSPRDWADQGTDQGVPWYGAPVEIVSVILT